MQRLELGGAFGHGPLPHRVGVLDSQVQRTVGAAERQRRDHPHLGELVRDGQRAVAEAQLDGQHLTAGQGDPAGLGGAEHRSVPGGGRVRVPGDQMAG